MRASEFITEEHKPTQIKLGNNDAAKAWIDRVYTKYSQTFQNNHVMPLGGTGDDQQFAMFELIPSFSKRGAVEVKWFQAYPLRQGVGSRAIQELQAMAREDGISLTLYPWDKGQISQAKLTKFYKGQGFKPTVKGAKNMAWTPEGVAEGSKNFNGIQLSLEIQKDDEFVDDDDTDNQTIFVQATASGRKLGYVVFAIDHDAKGIILVPQDLEVDERFRGQGIAATMYDYVKSKGYRIRRSDDQTPAGAGFWDKHKPGKDIWEQGVAEDN